jgi:GDP-L-fucose synthase
MKMNKSDRILVTGAKGLVGSALVEHLRQEGYESVIEVGRGDCDLTDTQATRHLFEHKRPDFVFHAAARVYGLGGNLKNKALSFYDNVMINTNVVDSSHRVGVRKLSVMGTGAVYPYPPPGLPFREDMIFMGEPHKSEDSYSHAKRAMLGMLRAYQESYGLEWAYIVCCNQFGPRDRFDAENGHVVPSLIRKFHEAKSSGGNVVVWGDGSALRDFMYVKDTARVATEIMQKLDGPINIGSGSVIAIREVVDMITDISGMHGRVVWDATKPNGREYLGYDLSRIQAIGFSCDFTTRKGLEETWSWYQDHGSEAIA